MGTKMFRSDISKVIVNFAFLYSSLICFFKGEDFYNQGEILYALFFWMCSLLSFLGALRFQIAKFVNFLRGKSEE